MQLSAPSGAKTDRQRGTGYRAAERGDLTRYRQHAEAIARALPAAEFKEDSGKTTLIETPWAVTQGWLALAEILEQETKFAVADVVRRLTQAMPRREQTMRRSPIRFVPKRGRGVSTIGSLPRDDGVPAIHLPQVRRP